MAAKKTIAEPVQFTSITPSGIEILYQASPKRLYRVRNPIRLPESSGAGGDIHPLDESEWIEVPSVTTVLDVLDNPALPWWGMKTGVAGSLELHRDGILREVQFNGRRVLAVPGPAGLGEAGLVVAGVDQVVEQLTKSKLTVNHVRDKARDRGLSVHDAFEVWTNDGSVPDPAMFPPEEAGYVQALVAFLEDAEPIALDAEVMVGSVVHGFAGRYDVRLRLTEARKLVVHRTPVRGAQYAVFEPGDYLGDLKTSKDVYPKKHFRQLEAYEGASIECGYEPTIGRFVIHVNSEGEYKIGRSKGTFDQFLKTLAVWRDDKELG